mgnify:CR=1 FL=1
MSLSTRPYLVRALHEWCADQGYTPYVAVWVDERVQVPMAFVQDGQIVLNVSYDATQGLRIDNEMLTFKGRFSGQVHDIMVPLSHVVAIYARETGEGMSFEPPEPAPQPPTEPSAPDDALAPGSGGSSPAAGSAVVKPFLRRVK